MTEVQGKEILLKYDGAIIARAKSFSLEVNREEIDITTLDSGGWKKTLSGIKAWSASCDGLVTRGTEVGKSDYHTLLTEMLTSEVAVELIFTSAVTGDKYLSGNALITAMSQSGSVGEVITYSVSFSGDGELKQLTVL